MPLLDSAALASVSYDETKRALRATFRDNRRTYIYEGVPPEEYTALMAAESRGAWFNAHIRDRYRFREVF
jgi:hypothetical protein